MKSLAQIWKFAFAKEEASVVGLPPTPYEIALKMAAALLSAGRFGDDFGAAMDSAWMMVIPFYQGQVAYERHARMLFDLTRHASSPEPDMTREEGRAMVAGEQGGPGGETGSIGEVPSDLSAASVGVVAAAPAFTVAQMGDGLGGIDLEALRERQRHISAEAIKPLG